MCEEGGGNRVFGARGDGSQEAPTRWSVRVLFCLLVTHPSITFCAFGHGGVRGEDAFQSHVQKSWASGQECLTSYC